MIDVIEIPAPPARSLSSANVGVSLIPKINILKVIEPVEWEVFAMGPNVAGVIESGVAAGVMINYFG